MEGELAILGFWIFAIVMVVKWGDVKRAQAYGSKGKEIESLEKRVLALEEQVGSMGSELIELKDSQDFAHKLIISETSSQSVNEPTSKSGQ